MLAKAPGVLGRPRCVLVPLLLAVVSAGSAPAQQRPSVTGLPTTESLVGGAFVLPVWPQWRLAASLARTGEQPVGPDVFVRPGGAVRAPDYRWEGVAIGAVALGVAGLLVASATCSLAETPSERCGVGTYVGSTAIGALLGGVVGGLVGGLFPKGQSP